MKKILFLMILMITMTVSTWAKPRLEGNKIYLDEAKSSKYTEESIVNICGGKSLGMANSHYMVALLCNPNKVIEFENEKLAKKYYKAIINTNWVPYDFYCWETDYFENLDFYLFILFYNKCQYDYEIIDGKVVTSWNENVTPTYCYVRGE